MIEHKTVIDRLEIDRDGIVSVRLTLEIVDDVAGVVASAYHRTMLPPGHDINLQMNAVNAHLQQMGRKPVDTAGIAKLHDVAGSIWKPEVVKAYRDKVAAAEAREAAANKSAKG